MSEQKEYRRIVDLIKIGLKGLEENDERAE